MARLGDRHFVLHETGAREHHWQGVGALSIKMFAGGQALYDTGAGRHAVDEDCYLVLNESQPYSISIEAERPMDSFCVFFKDGFAGEVKRGLESATDKLLEDPVGRPASAPRFFERSYPHDDIVTPALRRLRHASAGPAVPGALDEGLHGLMERLLLAHRAAVRESQSLKALRAATRDELYRRLHRARDYALASLDQPLSLEVLAGAACLSPSHFLRSFRELFGSTPHQFLIARRLERAAGLLRRTHRPVTDVALSVGFESLGSFSWLFRRRMGVSPVQYRARARKGDFREAGKALVG